MMPSDITLLERVVESSPVVLALCLVAIGMLWRQLVKKDEALLALHRETLTALGAVTRAVDELRQALKTQR